MCNAEKYLRNELEIEERLEFLEHLYHCRKCWERVAAKMRDENNYRKPVKMRHVPEARC